MINIFGAKSANPAVSDQGYKKTEADLAKDAQAYNASWLPAVAIDLNAWGMEIAHDQVNACKELYSRERPPKGKSNEWTVERVQSVWKGLTRVRLQPGQHSFQQRPAFNGAPEHFHSKVETLDVHLLDGLTPPQDGETFICEVEICMRTIGPRDFRQFARKNYYWMLNFRQVAQEAQNESTMHELAIVAEKPASISAQERVYAPAPVEIQTQHKQLGHIVLTRC